MCPVHGVARPGPDAAGAVFDAGPFRQPDEIPLLNGFPSSKLLYVNVARYTRI